MSDVVSGTGVVERLRAAGCVFAEEEAEMLLAAAAGPAELDLMVERRASGLPLEHVVGLARPGAVCVDLCCGSGAAGAVLLDRVEGAEVHASDIEPAAVRCARRNVEPRGGRVYEGDLFAPLPPELRGRVEVLVANVPYVPTGDIGLLPPEARDHEPLVTLDGGPDGLDVLRRVAAEAPGWLAPGGRLLVETSERQAERAVDAVTACGLEGQVLSCEERYATVLVATRAG
ncbi:putative protein N(5)-glutamine methyltransferase [Streptomyces sp. NPDC055912]|uniref:putative protein N(5)-glutamine methyltransferase n=1 Tax=Streptomyces sp. NPDC055912 TaxID=3345660 RepID=UPI0035D8A9DD